jgi:hypothetical protein
MPFNQVVLDLRAPLAVAGLFEVGSAPRGPAKIDLKDSIATAGEELGVAVEDPVVGQAGRPVVRRHHHRQPGAGGTLRQRQVAI